MADRQIIARANVATAYDLAQTLAAVVEDGRITSAQFRALAGALAGYLPARITLDQRTPKGAVYAHVITPGGETFDLTMTARCAIQHG